ncbi:hypothetical protein ACFX14_029337 [Malus domestica]
MQGEKKEKREKRMQHQTPVEARASATEESGRRSHRSTLTAERKKSHRGEEEARSGPTISLISFFDLIDF